MKNLSIFLEKEYKIGHRPICQLENEVCHASPLVYLVAIPQKENLDPQQLFKFLITIFSRKESSLICTLLDIGLMIFFK